MERLSQDRDFFALGELAVVTILLAAALSLRGPCISAEFAECGDY